MWRTLFIITGLAAALIRHHATAQDPPPPRRTVAVSTADELRRACVHAKGGDLIEMADGTYELREPIALRRRGTQEKPIVIRAKYRGKAIVTGSAGFHLQECAHVFIEGLCFTPKPKKPAITVLHSYMVRITRNRFELEETDNGPKLHWVVLDGESHHNRIDHNLFTNKRALGNFICSWGNRKRDHTCAQHNRIDHNHFLRVGPRVKNGKETIKIADSDFGMRDRSAFATIECNLFEDCSGESEILSVKSSDNTIRHNTFRGCAGTVTLRCGSRNTVEGNFFLNPTARKQCGGVKVYGRDHKVFNNYFEGLTGSGHTAPLALMSGEDVNREDKGLPVPRTPRAAKATVVFNSWVDCAPLQLGWPKDKERPAPPMACTFANNMVSGKGKLITIYPDVMGLVLRGNMAHTSGKGQTGTEGRPGGEFRVVDPSLYKSMKPNDFWRPSSDSPARDAALGSYPFVVDDVEGHKRTAPPDVGASERTADPAESADPATRRPLTPADVGPDAP